MEPRWAKETCRELLCCNRCHFRCPGAQVSSPNEEQDGKFRYVASADHQPLLLLFPSLFLNNSFLQVPGGCQFSGWIVPGESVRAGAHLTCAEEEKRLVLCAAFGPAAGASLGV